MKAQIAGNSVLINGDSQGSWHQSFPNMSQNGQDFHLGRDNSKVYFPTVCDPMLPMVSVGCERINCISLRRRSDFESHASCVEKHKRENCD